MKEHENKTILNNLLLFLSTFIFIVKSKCIHANVFMKIFTLDWCGKLNKL